MSRYIVELLVWKRVARHRSNSDTSCPWTGLEGVPEWNETDDAIDVWAKEQFESTFGGS
jgi:hypothetical protein